MFNMKKISIKEAINNDSGRTSSKKLIGFITSVLCLLLIVTLVFFYFFNMDQSGTILQLIDKIIVVFGIAAGLMGVKSISNAISARHVPTNSGIQPGNNNTYNNSYNYNDQQQYPEVNTENNNVEELED